MRLSICSLAVLCLTLSLLGQAQQPSATSSSSSVASSTMPNAAPPSERVVMKIGDQQITQAQFETMVSDLEAQQGPADLSRKAIGDNYAQLLMLSQQAAANKLDSSPAVIRQLALDRTQILSNAEFADLKRRPSRRRKRSAPITTRIWKTTTWCNCAGCSFGRRASDKNGHGLTRAGCRSAGRQGPAQAYSLG